MIAVSELCTIEDKAALAECSRLNSLDTATGLDPQKDKRLPRSLPR